MIKNRMLAVISLILFLLLLANLLVFRIQEEISLIAYVLIVAVFLIFFNKSKNT